VLFLDPGIESPLLQEEVLLGVDHEDPLGNAGIDSADLGPPVSGRRGVGLNPGGGALFGVPTKRFNKQIKRNISRFLSDFTFQFIVRSWKKR